MYKLSLVLYPADCNSLRQPDTEEKATPVKWFLKKKNLTIDRFPSFLGERMIHTYLPTYTYCPLLW